MYQSGKKTRKLYVLWCCWKHGIFREKKHLSQHGIRYTRSWRVWNCGTIECREFSLSPVAWVGGDGGSGILRTLHVSVSLPTEMDLQILSFEKVKRPNFQGRLVLSLREGLSRWKKHHLHECVVLSPTLMVVKWGKWQAGVVKDGQDGVFILLLKAGIHVW